MRSKASKKPIKKKVSVPPMPDLAYLLERTDFSLKGRAVSELAAEYCELLDVQRTFYPQRVLCEYYRFMADHYSSILDLMRG